MKAVMWFGKKEKLNPKYIGPYDVLENIEKVAYDELDLPYNLSRVHDLFHISELRKYIPDVSRVLQPETLELDDSLTYEH